MVCYLAKTSIYCFLGTAICFLIIFLPPAAYDYLTQITGGVILGPLLYFLLVNVLLKVFYEDEPYEVAIRASLLGFICALGIFIKTYVESGLQIFGVYMGVMSTFHYTEFLAIAIIQPDLVSTDSFVLNHSKQYTIAAITSWVEYFVEYYFFPYMKSFYLISNFGLIMCIFGDVLRKSAMLTARSNFNHIVQCEKSADHVLITHGVYSLCRHPSYVGWFYWCIGTQIALINPLCIGAYAFVSWSFFRERINIEEMTLLNFFGKQYCDYQECVGTGLPFIRGYKLRP